MAGNPSGREAPTEAALRIKVRRRDREVFEQDGISALMDRGQIGLIATSLEDHPNTNPNLFRYDPDTPHINFDAVVNGHTRTNNEHKPDACFCVASMGQRFPAETAQEFSIDCARMIPFGTASVIESEGDRRYAPKGLMDKYFLSPSPGEDHRSIPRGELDHSSLFDVEAKSWSGKGMRLVL